MQIDSGYLRRIAAMKPAELLNDNAFLRAQKLFFDVVSSLGGEVDFDIADMREVHAVATVWDHAEGARVLDLGCGSVEKYVLEDTFRDRYPPFFAEMMVRLGAHVTGIDIRDNPNASYDHLVLDLTQPDYIDKLEPPYDVIACLSLFNAPESPFENDPDLCHQLMNDMHTLLKQGGVLIVTLRDEFFTGADKTETYLKKYGFELLHAHGNSVWAKK